MDRVSTYIRQVLQDIYPSQELKSLTMMIWCDLLGMDALDIYLGKDINLSESKQYELENILQRLRKNEPIYTENGNLSGTLFLRSTGSTYSPSGDRRISGAYC